jgi:N-acetylmuramoyl-L-alanine amidase
VKLHWLLPGTFGTLFMLSSPTLAARLESWRFDVNRNLLTINTSGNVQPQAKLMFNPTRLVIDLPDTKFERTEQTQAVGGAISSISVREDEGITRLTVEFSPGYTINPQQVQFVGTRGNSWAVQLPRPTLERIGSVPINPDVAVAIDPENKSDFPRLGNATATVGRSQIERLQVTGDGFFIRTSGGNPQVMASRSSDRTRIYMDIANTTLSPSLSPQNFPVAKHGVSRIEFNQLQTTPPSVRMTLRVDKSSPDWGTSSNSGGGLVVLPDPLADNSSKDTRESLSPFPSPNKSSNPGSTATIQSVELAGGGTQLIIRGDRNFRATAAWDRDSSLFRIIIANARLAPEVKGPTFDANSPIMRVRLQQQDPNTVAVFVQPASGVQIGELNQVGDRLVALDLQSGRFRPPIGLPPLPRTSQVPFPNINNSPSRTTPYPSRPRVANGRAVVIIDPGHGGKDPGAIGIGGVNEKGIILPIGIRVAQILEQNGVQAILTRNSDFFVELQGRVDIAQRANATAFVSIHANSAGASRPDVSGLETYYYDSGLELARIVHSNILQGVSPRDRGVRRAKFFVLRKSSMPSILVETGYLTGQEDIVKLQTPEYQNQMAEAIARGILQYLGPR